MERLDKLLASQGMLSRREVKELITKGRVTIDGTVEKHPERKVTGEEQIVVAGELLRVQRTLTLMLHKPQGVVSAARDARDKTVLELVPPEYRRKELFPATAGTAVFLGRLHQAPENPQAIITGGSRNIHIFMVNWNYTSPL